LPKISDAEWRVLEVLWERAPTTANGVVDALEGEADWKPKTIHTLLRRLVDKGAVEYEKRGREFVYSPILAESECRLAESRSFLDKVFAGKVAPLLATFVEGADLSDEELEEMRKILEDAKGEGKK